MVKSPASGTLIRTISDGDLADVIALDAKVNGHSRPAYFTLRFAELTQQTLSGRQIGLAAESRGHLAGFVMGTLISGEFGVLETTAIVDSIAVDPGEQRTGIGRTLLYEFMRTSARSGAVAIQTFVAWNDWDLVHFFHSLGFTLGSTVPLVRRIDGALTAQSESEILR